MKRLMQKLMILIIVTGISSADINYQKKYKEQVIVNINIDREYQNYKTKSIEKINKKDKEIIKLKAKKDAEYVFRIWFTDKGITTDEVKGVICAGLSIYIHPVFLLGLFS